MHLTARLTQVHMYSTQQIRLLELEKSVNECRFTVDVIEQGSVNITGVMKRQTGVQSVQRSVVKRQIHCPQMLFHKVLETTTTTSVIPCKLATSRAFRPSKHVVVRRFHLVFG